MPIHPSMGNYENTLANALAYYYEQQERPFIFRCINRLDRDTSGLLIVAKNAYSSVVLSAQMKERHIHREYLAAVQGLAPERGTIDAVSYTHLAHAGHRSPPAHGKPVRGRD